MDPAEARQTLVERLDSGSRLDAETLNLAAFWMSRQLEEVPFTSAEAKEMARRLLRIVGRLVIDAAAAEDAPSAHWPDTREQVLLWMRECLSPLGYDVRPAPDSGRPELPDPSQDWD